MNRFSQVSAPQPIVRAWAIACFFLLFCLGGCDSGHPSPPSNEELLRREQAAREAELRRVKEAKDAAERTAIAAEASKRNWQIGCIVVVALGGIYLLVHSAKRPTPKIIASKSVSPVPPQTLSIVPAQPVESMYIIDGLNVARSFHHDSKFRIEMLITLCIKLRETGANFLCVFDAVTTHVARETGNPIQQEIYERLIIDYHHFFAKVTAGIQADDFILRRADTLGAKVITNDRFTKPEDKHVETYPWVLDPARLVKGRVLNGNLVVPTLGIDTHIVEDIFLATRQLYKLTRKDKAA